MIHCLFVSFFLESIEPIAVLSKCYTHVCLSLKISFLYISVRFLLSLCLYSIYRLIMSIKLLTVDTTLRFLCCFNDKCKLFMDLISLVNINYIKELVEKKQYNCIISNDVT